MVVVAHIGRWRRAAGVRPSSNKDKRGAAHSRPTTQQQQSSSSSLFPLRPSVRPSHRKVKWPRPRSPRPSVRPKSFFLVGLGRSLLQPTEQPLLFVHKAKRRKEVGVGGWMGGGR